MGKFKSESDGLTVIFGEETTWPSSVPTGAAAPAGTITWDSVLHTFDTGPFEITASSEPWPVEVVYDCPPGDAAGEKMADAVKKYLEEHGVKVVDG